MAARGKDGTFQKGTSGNPGGRPKGSGLKAAIERELVKKHPKARGRLKQDLIAQRLVLLGIAGDPAALRILLERTWPAKLDLNLMGRPLVTVRSYARDANREREFDDSEEEELEESI